MELKNDKISGNHAFNEFKHFLQENTRSIRITTSCIKLVNKVSCLHLDVSRRTDGSVFINDCATIDEFKETIERNTSYTTAKGYVLLYITGDESSVEAANDALMDNIRTCYAYGVENVETLKGRERYRDSETRNYLK